MVLGDGCVSKVGQFQFQHGECQLEYLKWKLKLLNENGIRTSAVTISRNTGYGSNKNKCVARTQITTFTRLLRKILYTPTKQISNIKLLNRLDPLGLAIWYMDDGNISYKKYKDSVRGFYITISTYTSKEETQKLIEYFKDKWDINFYMHKNKGKYCLQCSTKEGIKFVNIIRPHVLKCPSMVYKIQYDLSQRIRSLGTLDKVETGGTNNNIISKDIV